MKSDTKLTITVVVLVLLGLLGWWWWQREHPALDITPPVPAPASAPVGAASAPATAASAVLYPLAAASAASAAALPFSTPVAHTDKAVEGALVELAGRKGVLSYLQLDGFVPRVVATVDNLDRAHSAARLWPANPTPGQFLVRDADGVQTIDADNALRYAPFVQFIESVNLENAVALYRQLYPWFQQEYKDQGYPQGYFNDRLVAVIDHLLATPEPQAPVAVTLTEIKGPYPSTRPWVHYQFADPALEQLSSGQKLLIRMGAQNERRVKARLRELRKMLTQPAR